MWKARYGLLVITEEGRVKLWRTKMAGRKTKLEAIVGDWGRDDVRIEFNPGRGTSKITVAPAGEPAMFFEYISAIGGANQMVEWFAKTAGLPFAA